MVCVGIYAVLINGMIIADNIHSALFSVAAYTVILCFSRFKTGRDVYKRQEAMKAENHMVWVQSMNSIRCRAEEIIKTELSYW